jgi:serine protease Do
MARNIMETIRKEGRVVRGFLGIYIQDLTKDLASTFDYKGEGGALVGRVSEGSPAAEAGLREGDIVTALNGKELKDSKTLRNAVAALKPGSKAELTVFRDGKTIELSVKVGELPDADLSTAGEPSSRDLGMELEDLSPEMARRLGIDGTSGVYVSSVAALSPADKAGVQAGDVILSVQGKEVGSAGELRRELKKAEGRRGVRLMVLRGEATLYLFLPLE